MKLCLTTPKALLFITWMAAPSSAAIITYGTANLEGYGYPAGANPEQGATLTGLSPNAVTVSANAYEHSFPFSPAASDYPGTHQIYVGSNQTASRDGYSQYAGRIAGPQVVAMNYASLIPAGQSAANLTLGIGADDFQFPDWGDPFTVSINGVNDAALANQLMALNQTGPYEQFFSIGIPPADLLPSNVLTLSINEGGDGGDGWAIDFLTIGVTAVPEPNSIFGIAMAGMLLSVRRRRMAGQGSSKGSGRVC